MRFGKGPFDKLRDRGFGTVSELVELAVISCTGAKATARHSRESVESMDIKCQQWNSAYAKLTNAQGSEGDEGAEGAALRQAQGPGFLVRSVSLSNWPLLVAQGRKPPPVIPAKAWNPWTLNANNGTPHTRS